MAEVEARNARGATVAPISTIAYGKLNAVSGEHQLLVANGGLIDAFAEVFAKMSQSTVVAQTSQFSSGDNPSRKPGDTSPIEQKTDPASEEPLRATDPFNARDTVVPVDQEEGTAFSFESGEYPSDAIGLAQPEYLLMAAIEVVESENAQQRSIELDGELAPESAEHHETQRDGGRRHHAESVSNAVNADSSAAESGSDSDLAQRTSLVHDNEPESRTQRDGDRRNETPRATHRSEGNQSSSPRRYPGQSSPTTLLADDRIVTDSIESVVALNRGSTSNNTVTINAATINTATIKPVQGVAPSSARSDPPLTQRGTTRGLAQGISLGTTAAVSESTANLGTGPPSTTSDVVSRIKLIQRVSRAFQHLGTEGGSIRLRLAPAELGSVRVEMQVRDSKVRARVVAETEAASSALREHLPDLRARLESYGMQVERIEVETETSDHGFDTSQDDGSRWHAHQQRPGARESFTTSDKESVEPDTQTLNRNTDVVHGLPPGTQQGVDIRL